MYDSLPVECIRCAVDLSWKRIDTKATLYYPRNRHGRAFCGTDGIRRRRIRKLRKALLVAVEAPDASDPEFRLSAYLKGLGVSKPGAFVRLHCRILDQLQKEQKAALRATRRRGKTI